MAVRINPFHELYVGESIGPDKFVSLFSTVIVEHALSLFQPGHVILKGLPGSGKSMLLNLLKPSIRLAYAKAEEPFPIPDEFKKFIGAGINLKRSGISDFGQRTIDFQGQNQQTSPLYFGDFLNYWVISDIFHSINKLSSEAPNKAFTQEIGIDLDDRKIEVFTQKLVKLDCWLGYLNGVSNFVELKERINKRITTYRSFLNYNTSDLPEDIHTSKTLIGVPISQTVELLKESKILNIATEVYIRIDQYEELAWLDESANGLGSSYQEVINKLLGMRDTNVSYRIGTRPFAWTEDKKMFGTAARLEKKRNYTEISIDSVLKRKENKRTWVFPEFAEDIFARRLRLSPYKFEEQESSLIAFVFGNGLSPLETANKYVPNDKEKAIVLDEHWPKKWKDFLSVLTKEDPLSARLGEAWARQRDKGAIVKESITKPFPWEVKRWWKKERTEQALMQIASRNRQQLVWYGKDDILGLSGGNILIFLSLCQHIWDVWIRDKRSEFVTTLSLPNIDSEIQTIGIGETSNYWFDSISNEKGGKERKTFIRYLGAFFQKMLSDDIAMSYPGNNGFSMTVDDLQKNSIIFNFINDACDYGDFYDAPHTGKSDKTKRKKWYLNPILSPYFKIPFAHTKEPLYTNVNDFASWLVASGAFEKSDFKDLLLEKRSRSKSEKGEQGTLF